MYGKIQSNKGHQRTACLVIDSAPPPAIVSKGAAHAEAEAQRKCHKSTKSEPVGVPVLRRHALVTNAVADNAPQHHVDDPCNEGDEKRENGHDGHEDCAETVS